MKVTECDTVWFLHTNVPNTTVHLMTCTQFMHNVMHVHTVVMHQLFSVLSVSVACWLLLSVQNMQAAHTMEH